jgi:hypothetical protein
MELNKIAALSFRERGGEGGLAKAAGLRFRVYRQRNLVSQRELGILLGLSPVEYMPDRVWAADAPLAGAANVRVVAGGEGEDPQPGFEGY